MQPKGWAQAALGGHPELSPLPGSAPAAMVVPLVLHRRSKGQAGTGREGRR